MRDTWEVLMSNVEDLVKEDAVSHENLKTSCHLIAEVSLLVLLSTFLFFDVPSLIFHISLF